ncbi:FAD-binding oxidoreductase [Streptomyces venezuelae]|uniref:FAD-binding oxidoreductase n=1 Tax=Streptomyces venezuelae TaxID=54571 RepID=UPI0037A05BCA
MAESGNPGRSAAAPSRRHVLAATAAGGAAMAVGTGGTAGAAQGKPALRTGSPTAPTTPIGPEDARYLSLTQRGCNARFIGRPDYYRVVHSTAEVVDAVQRAVREGRRIAVRSGGHCFEDFVDHPDIKVVIDMSPMREISYATERRAFCVEPGAQLAEVYRELFIGWGVTIPAGATAEVGIGGHVVGGGYGVMSRRDGVSVDHLYALEVVVVDKDGTARAVIAERDPDSPHHDLWWAHTGAGGGNFGVVTRYWFRSPGAHGEDPTELLPKAPASFLAFRAGWSWKDLDARDFKTLMRNHGQWCERNSEPDSPYANLFSVLMVNTTQAAGSGAVLAGVIDAAVPGARRLVDDYIAAVGRGVGAEPAIRRPPLSWLNALTSITDTRSSPFKVKSAYLRKTYTERQLDVLHDHLRPSDDPAARISGTLWLVAYGGAARKVAPDATAVAQRDSILKAVYMAGWDAETQDGKRETEWVRSLYRGVYADSGGVPVPGAVSDGAFINYPDADLADPEQNTSGVPWYTLYYKDNYPRLQRVKAKYDPRDEFRHRLSIRPAR